MKTGKYVDASNLANFMHIAQRKEKWLKLKNIMITDYRY